MLLKHDFTEDIFDQIDDWKCLF